MKRKSKPFFDYPQEEVAIRDRVGKLPMFYRKVHMTGGVFGCDVRRARALLPNDDYHPLRATPSQAVMALHCLEYQDSDIGPYNEVSLSIGVHYGRSFLPSSTRILQAALSSQYHGYVIELPVNTEVALHGGLDYYNFPKYLADISFRDSGNHRICTVRDRETFDLIVEIQCRKIPTKSQVERRLSMTTYPRKDGHTLQAEVMLNLKEHNTSYLRNRISIRLGDHPRAESFRMLHQRLQLEYLYAPQGEAILFAPKVID